MEYQGNFDFFYGKESERLNFITIPKLLLKDERFKHISSEAKIIYGCLLDRNSLSQKNGWVDEKNRVYVIYTVNEMQRDLCCGTEKISKVLKELEGIGLIFRKRNGKGVANYIYVMDYMAIYRKKAEKVNFDNRNSRISKFENQEFRLSKCNKTERNKTEINQTGRNQTERSQRILCEERDRNKTGDAGRKMHSGRSPNAFCDFHQREYDFDALEQILLKSNPPFQDSS